MTVSAAAQETTGDTTGQTSPRSGINRVFALVVATVLVVAAVRFLHLRDLARALELVRHAGWPIAVVLIPTGVTMSLDARGWQLILATIGARVRWRVLLPVRLAAESLVLSIPGGSFAAEAAKLGLLRAAGGVPLSLGGASLALSKACHIGGEAIYLGVAATFIVVSDVEHGRRGLLSPPTLAVVASVVVAATSAFIFLSIRDVNRVLGAFRVLTSKSKRLGRWADGQRAGFAALDRAAQGFFAAPLSTRLACFLHFALEWFVEGLETFLILRCLGVHIGLSTAIVVDGIGSLLRAMAFFVPAGLGVQDAAQVAVLGMLGVPDAGVSGAALIVVKRTKEVFWLFTGLAIGAVKRVTWLNTRPEPDELARLGPPEASPAGGRVSGGGPGFAQQADAPSGAAASLPTRNQTLTWNEGNPTS
jgi:uncharacterized membrane protein YbhN (UPF0104 family)